MKVFYLVRIACMLLLVGLISQGSAQTLLVTEDFESNDNGSNYRANEFDDGASDVWTRSDNSNNGPNNNTEHTYSGYLGNDWWCGEDIDATDNPLGTGSPGYLMLKTIDVSAYQSGSIEVKVYLAANTGTIKRYRANDYLQLKYAFNGNIATGANAVGAVPSQANLTAGTYSIFGAFYGSGTTVATSSALIQDTDLDGTNEGSQGPADSLKNAFAEWTFTFPVGATDTTLSVLFQALTSGGSEEIGIDHIRFFGISGGVPVSVMVTSQTNVVCSGSSTGSLTATASNGTAPYSYLWSNGAATATTTNLSVGTYTVTVTDNGGITATASATVTQNSPIVASAAVTTSITCNSATNGQITASQTSGTSPYTYAWNTGGTAALETGLGAGTYSVTITDANGCTDSASVILTQPATFAAVLSANTISCNGTAAGVAQASVSGGTAPYTYSWSNSGTQAIEGGLLAGTHTVTITDANGCGTIVDSVVITEPSAIVSSTTAVDANCFGAANGSINLTVSGGTAPYGYAWSNGPTTQDISNLTAGAYSVAITDTLGCHDTPTVVVNQPNLLVTNLDSFSNITCFGANNGSISVSASGGNGVYAYNWSNGDTTATVTGLSAGSYTVSVTDSNNCGPDLVVVSISEPTQLIGSITAQTNVSCNGDTTGTATVTASGGTGTISYLWSNSDTTSFISGLGAGTYTIAISDSNSCGPVLDTVIITEPNALALSIVNQTNVACNGDTSGAITVAVTGGTGTNTYLWSNGDTTSLISGLTVGSYTVTVSDTNGCSDTISATISEPNVLVLSNSVVNILCHGDSTGSIDLTVAGGSLPYTYLWSTADTTQDLATLPAGNYSVTVADNNGCSDTLSATLTQPSALNLSVNSVSDNQCFGDSAGVVSVITSGGTLPYSLNWSNSDTGSVINGLLSGAYTVTLTDGNGCTAITDTVVSEPTDIVVAVNTIINLNCNGDSNGFASVLASGGTGIYSYLWNTNDTVAQISSLMGGNYTVTVTDLNGCVDSLTVTVSEPAAIAVISTTTDVLCPGGTDGTATLGLTGGSGPLNVNWGGQNPNQLSAGSWTFVVTDSLGCSLVDSAVVNEPPAINITSAVTDETANLNDGSIDLTIAGGTSPYTFIWAPGGETTEDLNGLTTGTYTVTITDNNGCSNSFPVFVGSEVGVASVTTGSQLLLFPNPARNQTTVQWNNESNASGHLEVFNLAGQIVITQLLPKPGNYPLDLSQLESGVYLLKLVSEGSSQTLRLVVD